MNNMEALDRYLLEKQLRFTKSTIYRYKITIRQFLSTQTKDLNLINAFDIRYWLGELANLGYNQSTIKKNLFSLRSFFGFCLEEEWIHNNPTEGIFIRLPETLPKYLTHEQLNALRNIASDDVQNRAIVETLYATGIRVNELTKIQLEDINWEKQIILIQGKGNIERIVPFSTLCKARLQEYVSERSTFSTFLFLNSFNTPIQTQTVRKIFRSYAKRLGFVVTPHVLRHTVAVHLVQQDFTDEEIQYFLGHENIENSRIYTRMFAHARKQMYDRYS